MTTLMKEAITEATTLPDDVQDFVAALMLENIRDAQHWDAQFAASKDVLPELAASDTSGPVYTLEELLAGVSEQNRHGEINMGQAAGKEIW